MASLIEFLIDFFWYFEILYELIYQIRHTNGNHFKLTFEIWIPNGFHVTDEIRDVNYLCCLVCE